MGAKGGEKISYEFVSQGCKVTLIARSNRLLKKIVSNLNRIRSGNNYFAINLMPEGNPTKAIKKVFKLYGPHEIIINCVGGGMGVNNPPKNIKIGVKFGDLIAAIESNMTALKYLHKSKFARFIHISSSNMEN